MALGEWISVKSSQELYENQMQLEMDELETNPEGETREIALIYMAKGIPEAQAKEMAAGMMNDPKQAHELLVREELGINAEELKGSALEAALYSFFLFALGAVIPVLPFMFTSGMKALIISVVSSAAGLFLIGAAITLFTGRNVWFSGGQANAVWAYSRSHHLWYRKDHWRCHCLMRTKNIYIFCSFTPMAGRKFNIAFSTIGTMPFALYLRMVFTFRVYPRYYVRCFIAGLISIVAEPFRWLEIALFSGKLSRTELPKSPVFILGHWRSGTTLLHNAMAQDRQFAFINTFQSVFANQFFASRWLFKPLMRMLMPEKRPADNVLLSTEFPQEEGIALSNINSFGFYNFFYFPRDWKEMYARYISGEASSADQIRKIRSPVQAAYCPGLD